ncbi:MAG: GNAT family N-acetyltransferase [Pyrinomonadaceae bacterium]
MPRVTEQPQAEIEIRELTTVEEFDACVRLQRAAFGLEDLELSPRRHLVVSRSAGGWTLGAFAGAELVGFVHHLAAVRGGDEIIGYSHMMAVSPAAQNQGLGARLKWAQRARALREGRRFIRWTWDPLRARNAHFNLNRLGAVVRQYEVNYYGTDYVTMPGEVGRRHGLDSDRLAAEWELDSDRVAECDRAGFAPPFSTNEPAASVAIPPDWGALLHEDPEAARRELLRVRTEFQAAFATGLVCAGFERGEATPRYLFYQTGTSDE